MNFIPHTNKKTNAIVAKGCISAPPARPLTGCKVRGDLKTLISLVSLLALPALAYAQNNPTDHFVLQITTNPGTNPADKSFTFYTQDTNYDIDWNNDQTFESADTGVSGNQSHTFNTTGVHTIRFRSLNDVYINHQADTAKYSSIEQWGTAVWNAEMDSAFQGARNLTMNSNAGIPDMSAVTNMSGMFQYATSFNGDISRWNTAQVTNMEGMFEEADSFNQDISRWNTASVTDMDYMFAGATSFDQDIGNWNTEQVGNMDYMFAGATSFDQNIGNWNTEQVTAMRGLFYKASLFNGDIGNWNTGQVTDMSGMFYEASLFNGDISRWNTAKVTSMSYMFFGATAFNQDIGEWNVAKVRSMGSMFRGATAFNQNIGGWNVRQVEYMGNMFLGASAFNQNLGRWYIRDGEWTMSSTIMAGDTVATITAQNTVLDAHNPVYTLSGTDAHLFTLTGNVLTIKAPPATGKSSYTITIASTGAFGTNNQREVTVIVNEAGSVANFITTWRTTTANESITIPTTGTGYNYVVHWGDGSSESGQRGNATHTYASAGDYTVSIGGVFPRIYFGDFYFSNRDERSKIRDVTQWGNVAWTSMAGAFQGANNLTMTATDAPDLSGVTSMRSMFFGASSFNGDISGWNTASVTHMGDMFSGATSFDQNIGNWNTAQVTDMRWMFDRATSFDQDIGGWNVEAVRQSTYSGMTDMFAGVTLSPTNYDSLLVGWNRQTLQPDVYFHGGTSKYKSDAAHTARANMTATTANGGDGWTITDGGRVQPDDAPTDIFLSSTSIAENAGPNAVVGTLSTNVGASSYTYALATGTGDTDNTSFRISGTALQLTASADYETKSTYAVRLKVNGVTPEVAKQFTITVTDVDEGDPTHFVLKITTTEGTNPNDKSFTFYTQDTNYDIDWNNDGVFEATDVSENQSHTFPTAGTHTIRFRNLNDIYINNQADTAKYTSIEQWGTSVWNADMRDAFRGASNLTMNPNAGTPDMSRVTNMAGMFAFATSFNGDIGNWNTASVMNMRSMFFNATSFNQDIGNWNTAQVTNMLGMFSEATAFDQNVGGWNTARVMNMSAMFQNADAFNQDISRWNTEKVTRMSSMFREASAFNQDIGGWNVEAVMGAQGQFSSMTNMFAGVTLSPTNYDSLLVGWNRQNLQTRVTFHGGTSKYSSNAAHTARENMKATTANSGDNWTITDGGRVQPDDAPTAIFLSSTSIAENAGANAVVGTLSTNGGASSYTYALATGTGATDNGSFNISGTALQLTASANYDTKSTYAVRLKVNGVTPAVAKQFTITVTDVNEQHANNAPVFAGGATVAVAYAENATTAVTVVFATDADVGQIVTFSLSGADAGQFTITPAGVLTFKTAPDYEMPTDTGRDNVYEVTITATDDGTPEMSATQTLTITVTDVVNEITTTETVKDNTRRIPYSSQGSSINNYRIVAIPFSFRTVTNTFEELFPVDPTKWRLVSYDNASHSYNDVTDALAPGNGYFFISINAVTLKVGGQGIRLTNGAIRRPMATGFNLIGNPFTSTLNWDEVVTYNIRQGNIPKGTATNLVTFDGTFQVDTRSTLSAYEGAFFQTDGALPNFVIPLSSASVSGRINQPTESKPKKINIDTDQWELNLYLDSDELGYDIGAIGFHAAATDGRDKYDFPHIPQFEKYVKIDFGEDKSRDIRPAASFKSWDFTIPSNLEDKHFRLGWDRPVSDKYTVMLYDSQAGSLYDLKDKVEINIANDPGAEHSLLFGTPKDIYQWLGSKRTILVSFYPNPASDVLNIEMVSPKESDTRISLVSLSGRTMYRSTRHLSIGINKIELAVNEGAIPNGIYLLQLEGEGFNITSKVVKR